MMKYIFDMALQDNSLIQMIDLDTCDHKNQPGAQWCACHGWTCNACNPHGKLKPTLDAKFKKFV
jgi:hypothetical protein